MAHHMIDLRLRAGCSFEEAVRDSDILQKLSQEPGFLFLDWGYWVEDNSQVQLLLGWQNSIVSDRMSALQDTVLHHLLPLQPFLAPNASPEICTVSALFRTYFEGRSASVLTFSMPLSISDTTKDFPFAMSALVSNPTEQGSAYLPADGGEEKTWEQKIKSACRGFEGGWIEMSHGKSLESSTDNTRSPTNPAKAQEARTYKAIVTWESPELEAAFKAQAKRHSYLRLVGGIRGLELHGLDPINHRQQGQSGELLGKHDLSYQTDGFWNPLVETWATAGFEEHHCIFQRLSVEKVTTSASGDGRRFGSCSVQ